MTWYAEVRRRRLELGLSQAELAQRSGVSAGLINKIEQGRVVESKHKSSIMRALDADVAVDYSKKVQVSFVGITVRISDQHLSDLGLHYLSNKVLETVATPNSLANSSNAYAVYMQDDLMSPEFEFGDIVFINPLLPIVPGCTATIHRAPTDDEIQQCLLIDGYTPVSVFQFGRIISVSPLKWKIRRWCDEQATEIELDRKIWKRSERIVLRELRR